MESRERPQAFRSSSFSSPLPAASAAPPTPRTTSAMKAVFSPSPPSNAIASPSRPSLTSSISMPSLHLSDHTPTPSPSKPVPQSPNYHPYRIRTSSSGVLSRSNSSPAQPLASLSGHRSSRSMGNLKEVAETQDGTAESSENTTPVKDTSKRRSMDGSPAGWSGGLISRVGGPVHQRRMTHSRNSSISSIGDISDGSLADVRRKARGVSMAVAAATLEGLSSSVKTWSSVEVSRYIAFALAPAATAAVQTDMPQRPRKPLDSEVVQDICVWITEHNVQGRSFLRGAESHWANDGKQPPFLPILLSLSRNLRRASLKGKVLEQERGHYYLRHFSAEESEMAYTKVVDSGKHKHSHSKDGSVLREEEEAGSDARDALTPLTEEALQSLGAAAERSDSALASEDGESILGSDFGGADQAMQPSGTSDLAFSQGPGLLDESMSKWGPLIKRKQRRSSEASSASEVSLDIIQLATVQDLAAPPELQAANDLPQAAGSSDVAILQPSMETSPALPLHTPPPAYEIEAGRPAPPQAAKVTQARAAIGLGIQDSPITPASSATDDAADSAVSSKRRSYGYLGDADFARRQPTSRSKILAAGNPELMSDRDETDRRVTIRASRPDMPGGQTSVDVGNPGPAAQTVDASVDDAEKQLLKRMIEELSQRLQAAEARLERLDSRPVHPEPRRSLWTRIFAGSADIVPRSKSDLPLYLVLVGIGVGVVVSKVLFGRAGRT